MDVVDAAAAAPTSADVAAAVDALVAVLEQSRAPMLVHELASAWRRSPVVADTAVARWVGGAVEASASRGWRPVDVARAVVANASAAQVGLLSASVGVDPPAAVTRWRGGHALGPERAAADAVAVRHLVRSLPSIPFVTDPGTTKGVDEGVLGKVRALLAKAESTTFEAEADALVGKAHELMVRHAIDQALLDGRRADGGVCVRRVFLEDPYQRAKFSLLAEVAHASTCQALLSPSFGFATVFGHADDLDAVDLLFTSLLLQATAQLVDARPAAGRRPAPSQVAAYRRSWLLAYAHRIGERLAASSATAVADAERHHGGSLAPVLVARAAAVDATVRAAVPRTRSMRTRASSGEGWVAGRAAGDRATLARQGPLPTRRRALGR